MFELAITNNHKSSFIILPENRYGFSKELHDSVFYSDNKIHISGLRFKGETCDYLETSDYVVTIVGKIFNRLAFSRKLEFIDASEVLSQYLHKKETFLDELKGNFIIVIYNRREESLYLVKDVLGLKYLYHKFENGKFYISTNLNDFKQITKQINYSAVIEKVLFTYPIGEESYIEDVFMLKEGGRLLFKHDKMFKDTHANIDDIFKHQEPLKKLNRQTFLDLFEKSVLQSSSVAEKLNVSLTGGFDGRSNIAVLLNHKKQFHAYSFGKQGGENTSVPLNVANILGLEYEPVFLDKKYEQNYVQCALDALYFSDGTSSFERANYIYAMQKIAHNSHYNITGLIGGEMFAPVHMKTDYINSTYYDMIYLGSDFSIESLLVKKGLNDHIQKKITSNNVIQEKIDKNIQTRRNLISNWKKDDFGWLYYIKDFITLGFRQFYGNQMHLERYYNENLSPFYDVDLIEYIFSTRHIMLYQNAFKDSPILRRNNRKLQTWLITNFSKELAKIPVDRGYPPIYTTDIRALLIPFLYYKRRYKLKHTPPEFDSPTWSKLLYNQLINDFSLNSDEFLVSNHLITTLREYENTKYNKTLNQLLSIAIWLSHESNKE
jgi:asparagine synthetase B (glutamine-hydrolysing)